MTGLSLILLLLVPAVAMRGEVRLPLEGVGLGAVMGAGGRAGRALGGGGRREGVGIVEGRGEGGGWGVVQY